MSEGKDARDTPAPADRGESEGGAAMSPAVTEDSGEGGAAIAPAVTEDSGEGGAAIAPAVSEDSNEGGAAIAPAVSEDNNEGGAAMDPTVSEYSSEFKAPLPSTYSEDMSGLRAPLPSTWEDSSSDSSEAAVPPTEDKGKGKATTPPAVDEDQTMEPLAPVMSYELGSDHLDLPSDEEPKYEGKGKGRSESFSHLPSPGQSAPSTAPSTRPTSNVQDDLAPSTAPTTRPTSEVKDGSGPSTAVPTIEVQDCSVPSTAEPTSEIQDDSGPSTAGPSSEAQDDLGPNTAGPSTPGPSTAGPSSEAQDGSGPSSAGPSTSGPSTPGPSTPGPSTAGPSTAGPSTAGPSTPGPSTAPTAKPVSQAQADPEPTGADSNSSITEETEEPAATTTSDDSEAVTAEGPHTAQSSSGALEPHNQEPLKNKIGTYECGCIDIYDDTGKKRQQACMKHRLNPERSILPLPPKKPLGVLTNLPGETHDLSVRTPQASRDDESPRQPPEMTSTRGRNFVQVSENSLTFLDPFNSERAIEPTGPPNTLTTIPTQEYEPPEEKSTGRVSIAKEAGPKAASPNAADQVAAQNITNSPQGHDGASGSQAKQPQKVQVVEDQDLGSRSPKDAEGTGEKATTEPKSVAGGNDENEGAVVSDEKLIYNPNAYKQGVLTAFSPHHREDITPKSILKKTAEPTAEAALDQDSENPPDPHGGAKLFRAAVAKAKASRISRAVKEYSGPSGSSGPSNSTETPSVAPPTPRLTLEMNTASVADVDDEDADRAGKNCPNCPSKCNLL